MPSKETGAETTKRIIKKLTEVPIFFLEAIEIS